MIKPYLQDKKLLDSIYTIQGNADQLDVWWLGQSGFLVKYLGRHLLIDPYLSDSLTKKYADTDKPHVRMSEMAISPRDLNFIDVVTSSHNHTDHLDAETIIPLREVNPNLQMIIPEANRDFVCDRIQSKRSFPIGLNEGESVAVQQFVFHGIPAAHNELARDTLGRCRYMGYVIKAGPFAIYHSGDTLWHQDIIEALKPFDIDLAILPINGNKPERRVAGNLNAHEAAEMAHTIGAKTVIPCHYDMFRFNTADPQTFVDAAERKKQRYVVLRIGERWRGTM